VVRVLKFIFAVMAYLIGGCAALVGAGVGGFLMAGPRALLLALGPVRLAVLSRQEFADLLTPALTEEQPSAP
jgi:hypothetical protein